MDVIKVATPGTVGPVNGGGTGGSGVGEPTPPAVLEGWRDKDPHNPKWPTGGGGNIGGWDPRGGWEDKNPSDPWVAGDGSGWVIKADSTSFGKPVTGDIDGTGFGIRTGALPVDPGWWKTAKPWFNRSGDFGFQQPGEYDI